MADYKAQILICTNSKGAENRRHCGDKGGLAVLHKFHEVRTRHQMEQDVAISKTGCTSQHGACSPTQATVIIYGPKPELGGTWYIVSPEDVETLFEAHILTGQVIEHLRNPSISVAYSQHSS